MLAVKWIITVTVDMDSGPLLGIIYLSRVVCGLALMVFSYKTACTTLLDQTKLASVCMWVFSLRLFPTTPDLVRLNCTFFEFQNGLFRAYGYLFSMMDQFRHLNWQKCFSGH
jgi:hypothetical protein